jgi:hypothetical protein
MGSEIDKCSKESKGGKVGKVGKREQEDGLDLGGHRKGLDPRAKGLEEPAIEEANCPFLDTRRGKLISGVYEWVWRTSLSG